MRHLATAAIASALISGAAMYTLGARAARLDAFAPERAPVEAERAEAPPAAPAAFRPAAVPVTARVEAPPRVVYQAPSSEPAEQIEREHRSWVRTALVIGGSAASGAAIGGIIKGKKGALIGAAAGGGAASIYEARRR